MCTRYVPPELAEIERHWQIGSRDVPRWPREIFPRASGPFIRRAPVPEERELVVGQWGLIPFFAKSAKLTYSTSNSRSEEVASKASFKDAWRRAQRCIIPAVSFDEPNWESGKNVWWRFRRADSQPWALAGLWNRWTDPATGEQIESYTMLTLNANAHSLMSRMHKPERDKLTGEILPPEQQDKRSVAVLESSDFDTWLHGTLDEAKALIRLAPVEVFDAEAVIATTP